MADRIFLMPKFNKIERQYMGHALKMLFYFENMILKSVLDKLCI